MGLRATFRLPQRLSGICFQQQSIPRDYYSILGVSRNATIDEIKKAYYRLSKIHHPDLNTDEKNMQLFQQVSEAYNTLRSPERKRIYDVEHFLPEIPGGESESIDHEFAEEIMELNEQVDSFDNEEQLTEMLAGIKQQMSEDITKMEAAFAKNDVDQSRYHLNRLRYLVRTKSLINKKLGMPD